MNIDPTTAHQLLTNGAQMVDVREARELSIHSIPSAINIPITLFDINLLDFSKPIIFICKTGSRSASVVNYLIDKGYDNVFNLQGGIIRWANEGFTIN